MSVRPEDERPGIRRSKRGIAAMRRRKKSTNTGENIDRMRRIVGYILSSRPRRTLVQGCEVVHVAYILSFSR